MFSQVNSALQTSSVQGLESSQSESTAQPQELTSFSQLPRLSLVSTPSSTESTEQEIPSLQSTGEPD